MKSSSTRASRRELASQQPHSQRAARGRQLAIRVDKYTWVDIGSSFLPSDLLAAVLCAQLEAHEEIQATRRAIWQRYHDGLTDWATSNGIGLPYAPAYCSQSFHMFYLMLHSLEERQAFIAHLKACGVSAVFHYLPLHLSSMGQSFGGKAGDCPITEAASERLVRLPFHNGLTDDEQDRVIEAIHSFPCRKRDFGGTRESWWNEQQRSRTASTANL